MSTSSSSPSSILQNLYGINNVKDHISLVLDLDIPNYYAWNELFQTLCIGFGVIDHIKGSNSKLDDPEWNKIDSIVKLWIYSTISQSLYNKIFQEKATANQVWTKLWTVFRDKYATIYNNELRKIVMGDSSITDYCTRIEEIADHLDSVQHHVPEDDLVIYTINGLSPKFGHIARVIRNRSPMPSFKETRSMLLLEESRMSQIVLSLKHIIMLPDIILKATVSLDRNHGRLQRAHNCQVLGEGYQVVSDLENGEPYDNNVKSRVPHFDVLFGSNLFEDYIGQLYMAAIIEDEEHDSKLLKIKVQEGMREFLQERETKLITILKNRLQPFVKGQTAEFVNWATSEACHLSEAPFGEAMLQTIGYIYTRQAARELGKDQLYMVPFFVKCVCNIGHHMKSGFSAISGQNKLTEIKKGLKKLNKSEGKEEQIMKAVEEKKDQMLDCLWQINVLDIESTLSRVCQAVLKDPTVSKDELKQRAIGMKKLGTILQGAKRHDGAQG